MEKSPWWWCWPCLPIEFQGGCQSMWWYEIFRILGCWCFIIWELHEACYHIPSTSIEKEQTFVRWLSCWIYWFHRTLCIDDHPFCDCWRFQHPLACAIRKQCEMFRWSAWATQYYLTCPRSNTHWRIHSWSDPYSILKSLRQNNVAALRSPLGGMSRRHGETGQFRRKQSHTESIKPLTNLRFVVTLPCLYRPRSGKQTTTELANHYNVVLSKLIEKHAPLQTCPTADRPLVRWYTKKVIKAKQIRRQCERKWRHTSLQVHREIYKTQCALGKEDDHKSEVWLLYLWDRTVKVWQ